jgi:3-oxoadipate enol-lactonase
MRARVGDIELYYEVDGRGPYVVLGHSIGMDVQLWQPVAERLADAYTVVRYEARGHGRSDKPPGPYRVEEMAEDVYGLLLALDAPRAVVGGLSLGGSLAMALALAHPEAVQALILANTAARFESDPPGRWEARAQEVEREGFAPTERMQLDRWLTPAFQAAHPERVAPIARAYLANDRAGYAAAARALGSVDLRADLGRIHCPTLVIVGDEDEATTPATGRQIRRSIPGAALVEISPARHLSAWEQPDAVATAIRGFLARALADEAR